MGSYNLISEVIFWAFGFHSQVFHFFVLCLFFKVASHSRWSLPIDDAFCPLYALIFTHYSAASHLKCARFTSALRGMNVFRRCPCCPDWNKSQKDETKWAEPSAPFGLSRRLMYLHGCTGLSNLQEELTEHSIDSRRMDVDLGAPTSQYHSFVLVLTNTTLLNWEWGPHPLVSLCLPDSWDVYWGPQVTGLDWGGVEPEAEFLLKPSTIVLPCCSSPVRALLRGQDWRHSARPGPPTPWAKRTLQYCSCICGQAGGVKRGEVGGGGDTQYM